MLSVGFKSSEVTRENGKIVVRLFAGTKCVVLLRCEPEVARELARGVEAAAGAAPTRQGSFKLERTR